MSSNNISDNLGEVEIPTGEPILGVKNFSK